MLPRIAMGKPIDPHLDASATGKIFEGVDPVSVDQGHPDTHGHTVAHRLRVFKSATACELGFDRIRDRFWRQPGGSYRRVITNAFAAYSRRWETSAGMRQMSDAAALLRNLFLDRHQGIDPDPLAHHLPSARRPHDLDAVDLLVVAEAEVERQRALREIAGLAVV